MKAIMISIKPKWCALMMNGDKTVEVRISKALAKATQKLIDENGYADIYVYCTKDKDLCYKCINGGYDYDNWKVLENRDSDKDILNGKVAFKFRCYKVEEIKTCERHKVELIDKSCLSADEFYDYLTKGKNFLGQVLGYAIHISDLEIFDRPKELSEFKHCTEKTCIYGKCHQYMHCLKPLTKAPQNFCYVESEE